MKVCTEIKIYELDGKDLSLGSSLCIPVLNHPVKDDVVILDVEGKKYAVYGRELKRAIDNATNWRFI